MTTTTTIAAVTLVVIACACVHQCLRARSLRTSLAEAQEAAASLATRLRELEDDVLCDRARMHEINSIVAGITAATEVAGRKPPAERAALEAAVRAETLRLRRVLANRPAGDTAPIGVDRALDQVVATHRARGRQIVWQPGSTGVIAVADTLADVVDELLENAARHGTPHDIRIDVATRDDEVEVAVQDAGPGIDPALRDRIFAWGGRGADSPGSGIGLHVARRQVRSVGGDLRVADDGTAGARFVVTMPLHSVADEAPCDLTLAG